MSEEGKESKFSEYPEVVKFKGVGRVSLKDIHLIALSLVVLGIIFAVFAPPTGYLLLAIFILIAAGYDVLFIRKSQKPVEVSLYLQKDPVEAKYGEAKAGEIKAGTIVVNMDDPKELGFRPVSGGRFFVWVFASEDDARIVAKRLSMYLQVEN